MVNRVNGAGAVPNSRQPGKAGGAPSGASFGEMLQKARQESSEEQAQSAINFSKHAINRAEERGIELTPALMEQLAGTVEKAQEKGAKNILAFNATQAFIINVPFGRVITTMNQDEMKENVFTNIDGAVLL